VSDGCKCRSLSVEQSLIPVIEILHDIFKFCFKGVVIPKHPLVTALAHIHMAEEFDSFFRNHDCCWH